MSPVLAGWFFTTAPPGKPRAWDRYMETINGIDGTRISQGLLGGPSWTRAQEVTKCWALATLHHSRRPLCSAQSPRLHPPSFVTFPSLLLKYVSIPTTLQALFPSKVVPILPSGTETRVLPMLVCVSSPLVRGRRDKASGLMPPGPGSPPLLPRYFSGKTKHHTAEPKES